jgi:hypothetical protein
MRILPAIGLIIFIACSTSKVAEQKVKEDKLSTELFTKDSLSFSFERTVCFGTCPAYRITIANDGQCLYDGYKFVERQGLYKAVISKAEFDKITNEAKRIGYFEMADEYDAYVTDVPSVILMLSGPNGPKSIVDRMDAPEELKQFERFIDTMLLNLDWQKIDND